jgi:hypothetical protein
MEKWLKSIPSVESMDKLWSEGDWEVPTTDAGCNKAMLAVIDTVATDLGNTRTVCRSSYIHPWFLDAWSQGRLGEAPLCAFSNRSSTLDFEGEVWLLLVRGWHFFGWSIKPQDHRLDKEYDRRDEHENVNHCMNEGFDFTYSCWIGFVRH